MDTNTLTTQPATPDIWASEFVADELDRIFAEANGNEDIVMSFIPSLFGTSIKARYLGFRAVGLTTAQALEILSLDTRILQVWREETPEMIEFEYKHLPKLQSQVSAEIVRLGFLRNMTMFIFRDQTIINKMMTGMDNMTQREYIYGKYARSFYTPTHLLALDKASNPDKHRTQVVALQFNNQNVFELIEDDSGENMTMVERLENARDVNPGTDNSES